MLERKIDQAIEKEAMKTGMEWQAGRNIPAPAFFYNCRYGLSGIAGMI